MNKDLQDVIDALQAHLSHATVVRGYKYPVSAITCRDGTRFSVQASDFTYCKPRNNTGPWTHVEVMTLTDDVVPRNWEQDESKIGGFVPIEAVAQEILDRGFVTVSQGTVLRLENKNDC